MHLFYFFSGIFSVEALASFDRVFCSAADVFSLLAELSSDFLSVVSVLLENSLDFSVLVEDSSDFSVISFFSEEVSPDFSVVFSPSFSVVFSVLDYSDFFSVLVSVSDFFSVVASDAESGSFALSISSLYRSFAPSEIESNTAYALSSPNTFINASR